MFRDWIFGEIYFPILDSWSIFWRTIPMSYPILAGFSSRVSACHRIFSKLLVDDSVDVFFRKFMVRCWFQWIFFLRFRLSRREWTEWMFFFSVISPYPLVNIQKTMEHHHFSWENSLFLWPFSSSLFLCWPGRVTGDQPQLGSLNTTIARGHRLR